MSRYISEALAKEVTARADGRCEYCRIFIEDTYFGGEIDHIRSLKHGGQTTFENLALACQPCNRYKGTDIGSVSDDTGQFVRFYNPRSDGWPAHFQILQTGEIIGTTDIGGVTARILRFNEQERIEERNGLIEIGHYLTS